MKQVIIASMFALAATTASALEVGVTGGYDYAGDGRPTAGVTVTERWGKVGLTAGFDRSTKGDNDQNRYSLVAGYDVLTLGQATVAVKAGGAYLDNQLGSNGYAAVVGVGATYPLTKNIAATADYAYQRGQDRVSQFDGSRVTVGLRYKF